MKNLIRKAVSYAKRNPEKTKRYARKAYNTVSKRGSSKGKTSSK
ncbi:hypothetical protein [Salimicrobium album]|uniref:Uncharacterized protein n=3 Tax=Salimicrobium TaxID=351195 RepID=K2HBZ1_9BACI|nr:hypothetical protein [Salimicrobium album]EKE33105.1 hypothetical protein MJ3_01355 [Salimicrobium jeotgali]MBM7694900.1 hypothetical protein [Salimicrobium jeotgali]SDY03323.1 hypothetical protein SAMN04488081_1957 [Salimicrobium album]SIS73111.1 hypothetical protein SAMN05421758_104277 [Salimicrobium salexigens]